MPGFREVQFYLYGLWLLLRHDRNGLRFLDLTDRGALRSFWAIAWASPAILVSWLWWRNNFLQGMPSGVHAGGLFFFRLGLIEAANWLVPLVLAGLVCLILDMGQKFAPIVTVANWLALPVSYAYGLLILLMMFLPGMTGLIALLWMALLLFLVVAISRILWMICGPHVPTTAALTMVLLVPTMILSDLLEKYLGVYPG